MVTYIKILKVCHIWSISSISRYLSSVHTDSCAKCCMYHDTALLVLKEWACSADSLIDKEWWHRICLQCRRPGSVSEREEKGMTAHSKILAWRVLQMEEPRGLQSTGSQKSDTTERPTLLPWYALEHFYNNDD